MPHNWIYKLNESNSRIHKESVIRQCLTAANLGAVDAMQFLTVALYAYDPYQVFNVKKVPTTTGITSSENNFERFTGLLNRLVHRKVTGQAAAAEIERCSIGFDSALWNDLLRPAILKDLRVGATVTTFNKVLKGTVYEIPVFECQLASDSAKHQNKMVGMKRLEPKLDGIRALAIVDKGFSDISEVLIFSRNGKPLINFPKIRSQLSECLRINQIGPPWSDNRLTRFVLDGEIVAENFQSLMKQAQRKTDVDTSSAVYVIFDVIPLPDFSNGNWDVPQRKRSTEWLNELRDRVNATCPNLRITDGLTVDLDTAEGHDIMHRYAQGQVAAGLEGIMIKDLNAPYQCKRGTAWMKWKPFVTVDLTVVGFEEGTGRNTDRLGALVCEGVDDGQTIKVNVGTGLSDDQRDEFWARRDELLGFVVEVKADAVTQNQDGTYSLRFPRFNGFRGFVPGDKI